MNNSGAVRATKSVGHLHHDADLLQQWHGLAACNDLVEILAFHQLHHDVRQAVIVPEIVDRDNVLVPESSSCRSFVFEAGEELTIA